jgi:hypothetical protein
MNYLRIIKKRTPKRSLVPLTKQPKALKNQGLNKAIHSFQREYSTRDFRD